MATEKDWSSSKILAVAQVRAWARPSPPTSRDSRWLRRVKKNRDALWERAPVTIGIAVLFNWNYGTGDKPDLAPAALVLTDRMITAGDIQYEPQQTKVAYVTPRVLLTIAGDYSVHSQAIKKTLERFKNDPDASPEAVAIFYGRTIQAIKLKEAEDIYLAPLGLNSDTFLAQQKDMAPHFVTMLTDQMQTYRGEEVEAIIVGIQNNIVHLFGVDSKGTISCFNDVGFAAIGAGAMHARSRLMQVGYTNIVFLSPAVCLAFAAKKAAELAPGVGASTDIVLVLRSGIDRLASKWAEKVDELYREYRPRADALGLEYIQRFNDSLNSPTPQVTDDATKGPAGIDAQIKERDDPPTAETARRDEDGAQEAS